MKPVVGLALAFAFALVACKGESKRETGGTAGGEILPSSISDAMLPHDTVRSQAPLAPKPEGGEADQDQPNSKVADKPKPPAEPAPAEAVAAEPAAPAQ